MIVASFEDKRFRYEYKEKNGKYSVLFFSKTDPLVREVFISKEEFEHDVEHIKAEEKNEMFN